MSYIEGSLKLVCGTVELTIVQFAETKFPRNRINGPGLEYADSGNPVQSGTFYEPKHQWEFTAELDAEDTNTLQRLYDYWLLTKPRPVVYIHDYTKPISEASQTRALADSATLVTLTNPSGAKEYYAKFKAQWINEPNRVKDGRYRQIACLLQELDKAAP